MVSNNGQVETQSEWHSLVGGLVAGGMGSIMGVCVSWWLVVVGSVVAGVAEQVGRVLGHHNRTSRGMY